MRSNVPRVPEYHRRSAKEARKRNHVQAVIKIFPERRRLNRFFESRVEDDITRTSTRIGPPTDTLEPLFGGDAQNLTLGAERHITDLVNKSVPPRLFEHADFDRHAGGVFLPSSRFICSGTMFAAFMPRTGRLRVLVLVNEQHTVLFRRPLHLTPAPVNLSRDFSVRSDCAAPLDQSIRTRRNCGF